MPHTLPHRVTTVRPELKGPKPPPVTVMATPPPKLPERGPTDVTCTHNKQGHEQETKPYDTSITTTHNITCTGKRRTQGYLVHKQEDIE